MPQRYPRRHKTGPSGISGRGYDNRNRLGGLLDSPCWRHRTGHYHVKRQAREFHRKLCEALGLSFMKAWLKGNISAFNSPAQPGRLEVVPEEPET
jgi:hypothetical protein